MGSRRFRIAAMCLAVVGCGTSSDPTAPSADPTPGWQSAALVQTAGPVRRDLFGGTYPPSVGLALAADGRGWLAWARSSPPLVEAARFDGAWRTPVLVRDASVASDGVPGTDVYGVTLAGNRRGEVVAAWTEGRGGEWIVHASRGNGPAWEAAARIQDAPTATDGRGRGRGHGIFGAPDATLDEDRQAWLLWDRGPRVTGPTLLPLTLMASGRGPEGDWAREEIVADPSIYEGGAVAAPLPGGELLVVWSQRGTLRSALLSPSLSLQHGLASEADASSSLSIAAAPDGGAVVSWVQGPFAPFHDLAATRIGGGLEVGAPVPIAPTGNSAARLAASTRGVVFVAWTDGATLWARSAPSIEAPFGPAAAVATLRPLSSSATSAARLFNLAADDAGNAFLAWVDGDRDTAPRLAAARFTAGQGWGEAVVLHASPQRATYSEPEVAVDAGGNAIVAFSVAPALGVGEEIEIRAARYVVR